MMFRLLDTPDGCSTIACRWAFQTVVIADGVKVTMLVAMVVVKVGTLPSAYTPAAVCTEPWAAMLVGARETS